MMRLRTLQKGAWFCQKRPSATLSAQGTPLLYPSSRATVTRSFSISSSNRGGGSWRSPEEEGRSSYHSRRDESFRQQGRGRRGDSASSRMPRRGNDEGTSRQEWGGRAPRLQRWGNLDESKRSTPFVRRGVRGSAAEGRVLLHEENSLGRSKHATSKMCVGCGTEVRAGSDGREGMVAGRDAVGISDNQKMAKSARFINTTDEHLGNFVCHRCTSLQSGDIWSAYDALRDVSPKVFKEQLKHIVSRRKFGFCIMVVDATDPEHTAVRNLRQCVDKTPVLLVLNKIDLLPRMTEGDQFALKSKIQQTGLRFLHSFAVSATTGEGLDELARKLSEIIDGADVFVVGAANVGKSSVVKKLSTLLSSNEYFEGDNKSAKRRRDSVAKLKVTGSNLPGTTLQAVRIPCFPSDQHALWDTPGIINARALQYGIFPSHLMEPLTRPGAIAVPTPENGTDIMVRPGETILIEADWMNNTDDDEEEPCVLGRLDFIDAVSEVRAQAYLHPSLRIRVIPTSDAPTHATIPASHIHMVNQRIRQATGNRETGLNDSYSLPLMPYIAPERPTGELSPGKQEYHAKAGRYYMDISFASLGFISLSDTELFSTIPHCVKDSVFSKRRALYPTNLKEWLEDQDVLRDNDY